MTDDKPNWPTETGADLDALVQRLQKLGLDMDRHANEEWDEHEDVFAAVNAITDLRARCADHEAEVARLTAERDSATRAKDCFQRMTRAHWEALCAMRNSINEYIQMPNTDSGPLFSPEDGPIYADIAERVVADLAESRAYALALEQELHDRAEKAEAALVKAFCMGRDAAAAWHTMQAETAMGALCCGSDNYEIRRAGRVSDMHRGHSEAIRALTPPADLAAKIGGEA